jgi:hypothetical protein
VLTDASNVMVSVSNVAASITGAECCGHRALAEARPVWGWSSLFRARRSGGSAACRRSSRARIRGRGNPDRCCGSRTESVSLSDTLARRMSGRTSQCHIFECRSPYEFPRPARRRCFQLFLDNRGNVGTASSERNSWESLRLRRRRVGNRRQHWPALENATSHTSSRRSATSPCATTHRQTTRPRIARRQDDVEAAN